MTQDNTKISKTLSYWLRHKPDDGGLTLNAQGWAAVSEVLAALDAKGLAVDRALLEQVVATNDKRRFELSEDNENIRARQGHSVAVEGDWEERDPPAKLYHGTVDRFLEAIMTDGLRPMNRHHVHLSADIETAAKVGQRRGKPVILTIDSAAMAAEGARFMVTGNGVWLVAAVPPGFLARHD